MVRSLRTCRAHLALAAILAMSMVASSPRALAHVGGQPGALEADVDLRHLTIVMDAPWRVQIRPGRPTVIPLLYFFPETKAFWRRIEVLSIRVALSEGSSLILLYEDTARGGPVFGRSTRTGLTGEGITVVNGFGQVTTDADIVKDEVRPTDPNAPWSVAVIDDSNRGWHTILRLPVPPQALTDPVTRLTLVASIEYRRLGAADDRIHSVRRRLDVTLDGEPLPTFPGWVAYDTHVHSLAEHSADLSYKAIRKAFGGPVQMIREAAHAIGLTDSEVELHDRLVLTDHNTFFSDREWPRYGPTAAGIVAGQTEVLRPELAPYFTDERGQHVAEGQREFENYVGLVGATFGEEVTLAKPNGYFEFITGTLGSHLLTFSTRHFMGPFHGGRFFVFRDEPNPNTIEFVLSRIAADPHFPHGFCYAAHPFSPSLVDRRFLDGWNDRQVETAVRGDYVRTRPDGSLEYPFKGFELWNERMARYVATSMIVPDRMAALIEDPTQEPAWRSGNPNWDERLQHGLERYFGMVGAMFGHARPGRPEARFIRKLTMAAGSDAHGDFNRNTNALGRGVATLPQQILRFMKSFWVTDNAFGKVRTVVEPVGRDPSSAMAALAGLAHGHSVLSDGPVIDFELDAAGHFSGRDLSFTAEAVFADADGRMGGGGSMDGERTMLVPLGGTDVLIRYRMATAAALGGPIERIEVYRAEAGERIGLVRVERNTGPALVLRPQGRLDPRAPAGPDGWIVAPLAGAVGAAGQVVRPGSRGTPDSARGPAVVLGPVRRPSAFALGAFTHRNPEPPFDHRCYTNPIWVVPVAMTAQVAVWQDGMVPAGALTITFKLPISMTPDPPECALVPLDARGTSAGPPVPLAPAAGEGLRLGWRNDVRENIADSIYVVSNYLGPVRLSGAGSPVRWGLALRSPRDMHGNRLNTVAWRLEARGSTIVAIP